MALLTLDFVAKRYGTLPSVLLKSGNSLDIQAANIAAGYETYQYETAKAESENPGSKRLDRNLSAEEMQAMLNRVRGIE